MLSERSWIASPNVEYAQNRRSPFGARASPYDDVGLALLHGFLGNHQGHTHRRAQMLFEEWIGHVELREIINNQWRAGGGDASRKPLPDRNAHHFGDLLLDSPDSVHTQGR